MNEIRQKIKEAYQSHLQKTLSDDKVKKIDYNKFMVDMVESIDNNNYPYSVYCAQDMSSVLSLWIDFYKEKFENQKQETQKLKEENKALKEKIKIEFDCRPGGEIYLEAKEHFENLNSPNLDSPNSPNLER